MPVQSIPLVIVSTLCRLESVQGRHDHELTALARPDQERRQFEPPRAAGWPGQLPARIRRCARAPAPCRHRCQHSGQRPVPASIKVRITPFRCPATAIKVRSTPHSAGRSGAKRTLIGRRAGRSGVGRILIGPARRRPRAHVDLAASSKPAIRRRPHAGRRIHPRAGRSRRWLAFMLGQVNGEFGRFGGANEREQPQPDKLYGVRRLLVRKSAARLDLATGQIARSVDLRVLHPAESAGH